MELHLSLTEALLVFLVSGVVVVGTAIMLAKAGDVISSHTGMGHLWVGSLLVAGATSLPELVTNITAVRIDSPELAVGNVLGANMFNVSKLAVILSLLAGRDIFKKLSKGQEYLAIEAFVLTALAMFFIILGPTLNWGGVTPAAITLLVVYLIFSRILYTASKEGPTSTTEEEPDHSLRWGLVVFGICSVLVLVFAMLLTLSAEAIAEESGVSATFVGVLALAIVTSLPELIVAVAAIRIGAPELAVAGLYGSNAFNIAILGVADLA